MRGGILSLFSITATLCCLQLQRTHFLASGVPLPASFASSYYVPGTITGHGNRVNGVKPVPSSMCWWEGDLPQESRETQLQGEVSAMQRTQQGEVGWERGRHSGETENRGLDCVWGKNLHLRAPCGQRQEVEMWRQQVCGGEVGGAEAGQ